MDDKRLKLAKEALESGSYDKKTIKYIFPELKESEDEKMKRAIVHILYENYTDAAVIEGVEISEIITWLEKQGQEQKKVLKENL